jgi:hypothetical protein
MYDQFDSLQEMAEHYKRCRKRQSFVLSPVGIKGITCGTCKHLLTEDPPCKPDEEPLTDGYRGNRCEYNPKTKRVSAQHYTCSWESLLETILIRR